MPPRIDLAMRALHRRKHVLDRLFVVLRGGVGLRRNDEIAKDRAAGRRLELRLLCAEPIEFVAARRRRVRDPEIGKPDRIDLDGDVLGEHRSPVFGALGGDTSKSRKHRSSPHYGALTRCAPPCPARSPSGSPRARFSIPPPPIPPAPNNSPRSPA